MGAKLQFWFEFASTYSYLSAMRIDQIAAEQGVLVEWQPFLLGPIFAQQGWKTSPFNLYPAKGQYMWRDMERLCSERGLPLHRPDPFPQNSLRAARVALAIEDHDERGAFTRAVYSAEFGMGRDISESTVLSECLKTAKLPSSLMERAGDPDIKATLFEQSARAAKNGLFGAPSFLVEGELFWGDDRLIDAINHAKQI